MASLLEPPPLAAVAAVVGFAALSLALGMTGGRREAVAEESGDSALPDPEELSEGRTPDPSSATVGEGSYAPAHSPLATREPAPPTTPPLRRESGEVAPTLSPPSVGTTDEAGLER